MKSLSVQKYVVGASLFVSLFVVQATAVHAATTSALLPSGEGTNLAWTPSTGTVHYTLVDESACNGVTDYVSETTVGDRDSYQVSLATVPAGATITGVAVKPCASRNSSGGGSSVLDVFYRLNGVASADAGAYSLPTGTTPAVLATTTFSGLSTVKNASTTLEVGAVYTSGTKGIRLSHVATVVTYVTPPAAPSALSAIATSSLTAAALSWTDNASDETGFVVERSTDNISFGVVGSTSANVRNYTDAGLPTGTYYYRVNAVNAGGASLYATTSQSVVLTIPTAPTMTSVTATTTPIRALVRWVDNSSNETRFNIERSIDDVVFGLIGTASANLIFFSDASVASSTVYYYRVSATNALGTSTPSASMSVLIP